MPEIPNGRGEAESCWRQRSADSVYSHLRTASRAVGMLCLIGTLCAGAVGSDIKVFVTCYLLNLRLVGQRIVVKTPGQMICVL